MNDEIVFTVECDEETAFLVAFWDDPLGGGGISTQGIDLRELQEMILDATAGYFKAANRPAPGKVALHFTSDPKLALVR